MLAGHSPGCYLNRGDQKSIRGLVVRYPVLFDGPKTSSCPVLHQPKLLQFALALSESLDLLMLTCTGLIGPRELLTARVLERGHPGEPHPRTASWHLAGCSWAVLVWPAAPGGPSCCVGIARASTGHRWPQNRDEWLRRSHRAASAGGIEPHRRRSRVPIFTFGASRRSGPFADEFAFEFRNVLGAVLLALEVRGEEGQVEPYCWPREAQALGCRTPRTGSPRQAPGAC